MSALKIITYPDPILRQKSARIEDWDDAIEKLIIDMTDTLNAIPGLGLAAVQVGVPVRLFIYDEETGREEGKKEYSVLVNPEIVHSEGSIKEEEGCLSIPDYRETVVRAVTVRVSGLNRHRQPVEITAEGLLARVFQHEIDHLNGILFIDRLSSLKRSLFLRKMRKLQRQMKAELSGKI